MHIIAGTDGVGKTLEIRLEPNETKQDGTRHLAALIKFLVDELSKRNTGD